MTDRVRYQRSPGAVWRYAGDEVVVLPARGAEFVSLSSSAAALWQALEEPRSFHDLLEMLGVAYSVAPEDISASVAEAVTALEQAAAVQRIPPRLLVTNDVVADTLRAVAAHGLAGAETVWPAQPLDAEAWAALLGQARRQRLGGLLAAAVESGRLPSTPDQAAQAHSLHVDQMCAALVLESELLHLTLLLADAGVESRVLKGSGAAHLDYPDPSLRCFGDVDLLVRSSHFDRAVAALVSAGLTRRYPQPRPGFDARFSKGASFTTPEGIELDLHRTFVMGPFGLTIDLDDLWTEGRTFVVGSTTLTALDDEVRFLHACFHTALGDDPPRLVPQRDLVQMLLDGSLDVARVRALTDRWKAQPVVASAINTAWTSFAIADIVALSAWAARHVPDGRAQRDLDAYHGDEADYASKSLAAVHALPRLRDKVAFVAALAFPDAAYRRGRRGLVARALRVVRSRT